MLFSVPLFTPTTYIEEPNSFAYGLDLIYTLGPTTEAGEWVFKDTVKMQSELVESPLIQLYVNPNMNYTMVDGKRSFKKEDLAKAKEKGEKIYQFTLEWNDKSVNITNLRS